MKIHKNAKRERSCVRICRPCITETKNLSVICPLFNLVAQQQKMFYNVKAIISRRHKSACKQTNELGGFYSEKRNCFIHGLCVPDRDRVLCRRSGR